MTGIKGEKETTTRPGNKATAGIQYQGMDPDVKRWYEKGESK